jgi:polyisoprenoid-binding protein YceI
MKTVFPAAVLAAVAAGSAVATPVTYQIDPEHTQASFETDHLGGLSIRRGKFDTTKSGTVVLDRDAATGTVDVTIDAASMNTGVPKLDDHIKSDEMLDVAEYPTVTYQGKLTKFVSGAPTQVEGTLTMHGISKPVTLTIDQFLCKPHPMKQKEVCGADATATINRADWGVDYGIKYGFRMDTKVEIQVEALKAD